jgi:hypothetical protein
VALPDEHTVLLQPPDRAEVELLVRGFRSAAEPPGGLTTQQELLLRAVTKSMTGHDVDPRDGADIGPVEFAEALARRDETFRSRIVQVMLLAALILTPLPEEVADRVERYAHELGVEEGQLRVAHDFAEGSLGLALIDFERSGYAAQWRAEHSENLHTTRALQGAWDACVADPALALKWAALEQCPAGSLGRGVFQFYRARGFVFPGRVGSAPPFLAQHDWVHVLADYGSTVECELEVFGLIARAIEDPRGFSLLAMVVSLFETGYLSRGAGLFQADVGHLDQAGMATRLGDAMRRGALCGHDLLAVDWFAHAAHPVEQCRDELGIVAKDPAAIAAGSIGPWEAGGLSPFQERAGRDQAHAEGRAYEAFGATVGE